MDGNGDRYTGMEVVKNGGERREWGRRKGFL